jgi:hypothetical protein
MRTKVRILVANFLNTKEQGLTQLPEQRQSIAVKIFVKEMPEYASSGLAVRVKKDAVLDLELLKNIYQNDVRNKKKRTKQNNKRRWRERQT